MTQPTALIFGANGQDGFYLGQCCREAGIEPIGISRGGPFVHTDVADFEQVRRLVREHRPAYLFHLAARSTTHHDAIFDNHQAISTGAFNVLEAVRRDAPDCRVFITGSGVQFHNVGQPIRETEAFEASSPYSVSRIQAAYAARYFRLLGVRAYVGYLFHHESPRREAHHVSKMVALAARRISRGQEMRLEMGDISVRKEWTFAGDTARAILTLVQQEKVFEAVVGSGIAHTIEDWLGACFSRVGCDWKEYVIIKSGFVPEYRCLVSDPTTIRSLGWSPTVGLDQLAEMMVADD
jgi:GDPmannose 4,6-dehydratase